MPVYEFLCATCGSFEQRRSLQEVGEPMACPMCQIVATRIYSTAGLILTSGAVRRRIEQGAEPKVVNVQALRNHHRPHCSSPGVIAPGNLAMPRIQAQLSQACSAFSEYRFSLR
jgi:putative FmdB family regulatory protein